MITDILDNTAYGSRSDPKPLSNNILWAKSGLGVDMLFGDIRNIVPVSHEWLCRQAEAGGKSGWKGAGAGDEEYTGVASGGQR